MKDSRCPRSTKQASTLRAGMSIPAQWQCRRPPPDAPSVARSRSGSSHSPARAVQEGTPPVCSEPVGRFQEGRGEAGPLVTRRCDGSEANAATQAASFTSSIAFSSASPSPTSRRCLLHGGDEGVRRGRVMRGEHEGRWRRPAREEPGSRDPRKGPAQRRGHPRRRPRPGGNPRLENGLPGIFASPVSSWGEERSRGAPWSAASGKIFIVPSWFEDANYPRGLSTWGGAPAMGLAAQPFSNGGILSFDRQDF